MKIRHCTCGHRACTSFEFANVVDGKFRRDQAPAMLRALEEFIRDPGAAIQLRCPKCESWKTERIDEERVQCLDCCCISDFYEFSKAGER